MYVHVFVCMHVVNLLVGASMAFNNTTTKTTKTTHELLQFTDYVNSVTFTVGYKFLDFSHTHRRTINSDNLSLLTTGVLILKTHNQCFQTFISKAIKLSITAHV